MILVIDNYDSFTYNLVQYLGQCGADVVVKRNDKVDIGEIAQLAPKGIVLSPGPCTPNESGVCIDISSEALRPESPLCGTPLLGVCLGHQTIGMVAGATVGQAKVIMHGKTSLIDHDGKGLFKGIPNPTSVVRYHSLAVFETTMPVGFHVTARARDDGEIMGVRHSHFPIEGVQFHPESIMTEGGLQMVQNFLNLTDTYFPSPAPSM